MVDPPTITALLIADHVYIDQATGNQVIAGAFNRISVPAFPAVIKDKFIFVKLVDIRGPFQLRIEISHDGDATPVASVDLPTESAMEEAFYVLSFPPLPAIRDGVFRISAILNGGSGSDLSTKLRIACKLGGLET